MNKLTKAGIGAGASGLVLAALLTISDSGVQQIAKHEGTRLQAYPDVVGIPTICVGHTKGVKLGDRATFDQCRQYLHEDLSEHGKAVGRCVKVAVSQAQYDALVSFTFNVGSGAFCGSTLVKKLNAGDCLGAADQFKRWVYVKGRRDPVPGLVNRRAFEAAQFRKDCPDAN